jgi:dTDP-4-amino-4,6-dideoxygalactose transaminase
MRTKKKGRFPEWPVWDEGDVRAVESVVRTGDWWCGAPSAPAGGNVWAFQEEFRAFQEAKRCVAVSNGTVAIELALLALGVGLGDEVILSDYTFVASASAVVAVNAVPVLCDIDPRTLLMDVGETEALITPRTKAIIAVHLGGNPVDMQRLLPLAAGHGLGVLEDCAHAHGSRFRGRRVGTWGDAGTFSFQASKVLTAGEGGAVVSRDERLADRVYTLSDCGRRKGEYFYSHYEYGSNCRMSEFEAALLRTQLARFPAQHRLRNENARYLAARLNSIEGIEVMEPTHGAEELGYYTFPFLFDPAVFSGITKEEFARRLEDAGIPTDDPYPPLHSLDCFRTVSLRRGIDYSTANWGGEKSSDLRFPVASGAFRRSVQLAHNVLLAGRDDLDYVVGSIEKLKTATAAGRRPRRP